MKKLVCMILLYLGTRGRRGKIREKRILDHLDDLGIGF